MILGQLSVFGCLFHLSYVVLGIVSILDSHYGSDCVSPPNPIHGRAPNCESRFRREFKFRIGYRFRYGFKFLVGWVLWFSVDFIEVVLESKSYPGCCLVGVYGLSNLLFLCFMCVSTTGSVAGSKVCHGEGLGVMCLWCFGNLCYQTDVLVFNTIVTIHGRVI